MGKVEKKAAKRKTREHEIARRETERRLFNQRVNRFSSVSPANINVLKQSPANVIENVLTSHAAKRTLPSPLDRAFPRIDRCTWFAPPDQFTKSFAIEAKWAFARLGAHHIKLNALLSFRRRFAKHLILNDLDEAASTLSTCIQRFGVSTWSIEMELLLAEFRGGFEANRELLSRILERPLHHNERLMAEFASQRVDETLSPNQYTRTINAFITGGDYASQHVSLPFFLRFSLLPAYAQSGVISLEHASYLLYAFSTRPLIDHYLIGMRLLRHLFCNDQESAFEGIDGADQLARIRDVDTDALLSCAFSRVRPSLSSTVYHGYRLYAEGQYAALIELASAQIAQDPLCFAWYELLATATLQTRSSLPDCLPEQSHAKELLETIHRVLSYDEDVETAIPALVKASTALEGTPLGYQITGFCYRIARPKTYRRQLISAVYGLAIAPTAVAFLSEPVRSRALKSLSLNAMPESNVLATQLCRHRDMVAGSNSALPTEPTFALLLLAEIEQGRGEFQYALDKYNSLLLQTLPADRVAEAIRGAFACLLEMRRFNDAANLVASTSLPPIALFWLVDIDTAAAAYTQDSDSVDHKSIGWPILFMLQYKMGNVSIEDLFTVYANFIGTTGVVRPSQIGHNGIHKYGCPQFRFFLRWVCHQDLLDSDIEYSSTTDVEGERVAILQLLQEIDPDNLVAYANEISQLQQQLAVRKAMRHVAKSKIHFNAEGIEKSLGVTYSELFDRYCAMTRLTEGSRKSVELHWDTHGSGQDLFAEAPEVLFRDLFATLHYAFLWSNEYGLDSYLSVRIRHQTIKGALRSIFDRSHLVTETENGVYANNPVWNAELSALADDVGEQVQTALKTFSKTIDTIIGAVSNTWMRIRGAPDGQYGLFEISFTEGEVDVYRKRLENVTSMFDFNDYLFARLKERLGLCLDSIRTVFRNDLRLSFEMALQTLQVSIAAITNGQAPSINTAITHCRTELQNGIEEVCDWFQVQDAGQLEDFSIHTLVQASIDNISKCFPSSTFRCDVNCEHDLRFKGKCFIPLWYAFFQVFENVVTYAGEESADTKLQITSDDEFITFEFTNPLGGTQSETAVEATLEEKRNYRPEMIRRERGSGFHKLRKLIRTDLGDDANRVDLSVAGRIFTTRCQIRKSGVIT
ncbi:MAG: hypothetical protein AABP62_05260 [Planctomycetota bacterium]